jgi:hypothetical protein
MEHIKFKTENVIDTELYFIYNVVNADTYIEV